jgi:alkanesulfonate monooxygenase SsuD/methylene tetrahydromethanopterin reductase-like flavin-dependent oxidoreductase (luciferase family)
VRLIRDTAAACARDPDQIDIHLGVNVVMTEDEHALPKLVDNPIVKWFAGVILPINTSMFRDWGMPHPYGYDYNYHRDCIPEWVGADEFRLVTSAVPTEAVPKVMFVGTAAQVYAQIEPYLRYGVSEVAVSNQAAMCGSEFSSAASLAEHRLNDLLRAHEVTFTG